jgi:hypothetical protein
MSRRKSDISKSEEKNKIVFEGSSNSWKWKNKINNFKTLSPLAQA